MCKTIILITMRDEVGAVYTNGLKVSEGDIVHIYAEKLENGECPICGTELLDVSDVGNCPKCGVNLVLFEDLEIVANQEAVIKAYTYWQHRCDVCGKPIKDWEERHAYHELDCPASQTKDKQTFIGEVWCDCDLKAHPKCCPECK